MWLISLFALAQGAVLGPPLEITAVVGGVVPGNLEPGILALGPTTFGLYTTSATPVLISLDAAAPFDPAYANVVQTVGERLVCAANGTSLDHTLLANTAPCYAAGLVASTVWSTFPNEARTASTVVRHTTAGLEQCRATLENTVLSRYVTVFNMTTVATLQVMKPYLTLYKYVQGQVWLLFFGR